MVLAGIARPMLDGVMGWSAMLDCMVVVLGRPGGVKMPRVIVGNSALPLRGQRRVK